MGLNLHPVLGAEVHVNPLVDIGEAEPLLRLPAGAPYLAAKLFQLAFVHPHPVVPDRQAEHIPVLFPGNVDVSLGPLVLDAVVERVLHQGLQRQLQNLVIVQRRIDPDVVLQYVVVAHLLDFQVAPDMLFLLPQGNKLPSPAEHQSEKVGQRHHHVHGLVGLVVLDEPDNGVQRIVQEMGIDLLLQQAQIQLAQLLLVLLCPLDQKLQVSRHVVEPPGQNLNLVPGSHVGPGA